MSNVDNKLLLNIGALQWASGGRIE